MEDFGYKPMSEDEATAHRFQMLEPGIYDATIESYEGKMASTGNRMVVFTVRVYDKNSHHHDLKDYMTFTDSMTWKLRHHCIAAGLVSEFESGTWHPKMSVGKNLRVKVVIDKGKEIPVNKLNGKPPGSTYHDRNMIDDYISDGSTVAQVTEIDNNFNDEIPF